MISINLTLSLNRTNYVTVTEQNNSNTKIR